MPRARSVRRVLLRLALVGLAVLLGLELGARLLARAGGRPFDAEELRGAIDDACRVLSRKTFMPGGHQDRAEIDPGSSLAILSPYSGWENYRTHARLVEQRAHYASAAGKEAFDVCVLGGSVAQTFAQIGHRRLIERLKEDPRFAGRDIRVHEDACAGYKQPQPLMVLAYLLARGHEPDAVIEIDGFNEAALGWSNASLGANPAYPFLPNWARATNGLDLDPRVLEDLQAVRSTQRRASELAERFRASGWWRSAFLGRAGWALLERRRAAYVDAFRTYARGLKERPQALEIKGPPLALDEERTAESLVRSWEESSISMQGLCSARGILYLHVLQPALPDPGTKPLTAGEIERGVADPEWIEGVVRLYPLLREAGGRLSERGVAFLDATGILRDHPEEVYTDVCHFGDHGNAILADAIADALTRAAAR